MHTVTFPQFFLSHAAIYTGFEGDPSLAAVVGSVETPSRVFGVVYTSACASTAGLCTCLHEARAKCGLVLVPDLENHFPLAYAPPPVFGEPRKPGQNPSVLHPRLMYRQRWFLQHLSEPVLLAGAGSEVYFLAFV